MRANPYVGPRSIGDAAHAGEKLFGRDREIDDLTNMLIAERIVLLYSPSGAGKSSLLQAGVLPALQASGFQVRPIMRVGTEPPAEVNFDPANGNQYVLSALISLEEGVPAEKRRSNLELSRMNFVDYLGMEVNGEVLVFDQFEEILTARPMDYYERNEFFTLLGDALRHKGRWALFSMREDYMAACDPYVNLLPTHMSNTFRLNLLGPEAAKQAIRGPASERGVEFSEEAAEALVSNLRLMNVHEEDGSVSVKPGMHVEPVQLQVVCFRLWEQLAEGTALIGTEHVDRVGNVDEALGANYSDTVKRVAAESGVGERELRDWFDQRLITERNTRGQVVQGGEDTLGVTPALHGLLSSFLVRSDRRLGSFWFELAHDRLIGPVLASNRAWREANLSWLQKRAAEWLSANRSKDLLSAGGELAGMKQWAEGKVLRPAEQAFLAECETADQIRSQAARVEEERSRGRRWKWLFGVGSVVGVLVIGTLAAVVFAAALILDDANAERDRILFEVLTDIPINGLLEAHAAGGEVKPLEKGWVEIQKGETGLPLVTARNLGTWFGRTGIDQEDLPDDEPQGRIICVGHDGFLRADNGLFIKNALKWLRHENEGPILVVRAQGPSNADTAMARIREWGIPAEEGNPVDRIPLDRLEEASLLILTHGTQIGPRDVEAVHDFVSRGGGVLATGYGWVYAMYERNGGKVISGPGAERLLDEYPINRLMKQFGVRWTNEVSHWP